MGAWGYGLFQSDHDLDIMSELSAEAGLDKLQQKAEEQARATKCSQDTVDRIYYCIYAPCCSAEKETRQHLDSGVLANLIEEKEKDLFADPNPMKFAFRDPVYVYVLLGACAMTLGCKLPKSFVAMLKLVYREGGLMPDALKQMRKALFGPNGYKNGEPYDFESKGLLETANSMVDDNSNASGIVGMNVIGPGSIFNTGMGDSTTSVIMKELRAKHSNPEACGGCGAAEREDGKALLMCSRCKNRKYCNVVCQKQHWKVHKKICEAAAT